MGMHGSMGLTTGGGMMMKFGASGMDMGKGRHGGRMMKFKDKAASSTSSNSDTQI